MVLFSILFLIGIAQEDVDAPARLKIARISEEEYSAELARLPSVAAEDWVKGARQLLVDAGVPPGKLQTLAIPPMPRPEVVQALQLAQNRLQQMGVGTLEVEGILRTEELRLRSPGVSLLAQIPGSGFRKILLCTRLDPPPAGPGLVNNWSGLVLLANLLQSLRESQPRHTLIFVAFGGQDLGCRGSRAYLQELSEKHRGQIDAVITFECVGASDPAVWMSASDEGLVELARRSARRAEVNLEVRNFAGTLSDAHRFQKLKIPTLFLDGMDPAQAGRLGTAGDNDEWFDLGRLMQMERLVLQLIRDVDVQSKPLHLANVQRLLQLSPNRKPIEAVQVELGVGLVEVAATPETEPRAGSKTDRRKRPASERPDREGSPDEGAARPRPRPEGADPKNGAEGTNH